MKSIFTSLTLSSMILLSSCTTTLVSNKKKEIDSALQTGKTYTFVKNNGTQEKFRILKIEEDKITGKNDDEKNFVIEKADISKIKKSNTIGTVLIVVGALAAAVLIPAYVSNKPVGQ
ncbi:hypothetical protein Q73A0000_13355 [Kaistella flava (ex Peng et al. 2021)]|uniref:Lipoprotein n=1 Tax=Kaistella flava (ex Peng et al. 2021) TaxID=2038776 RepID=A0A7M2YD16_9FLAO|nr:hypothetical protein [Kaistella flava (ex Peng et al. 2021)]QOW11273.1 hypothetical protein Q73A0000_13355 [Kaistella flava (ex Peng et al. 2021)]